MTEQVDHRARLQTVRTIVTSASYNWRDERDLQDQIAAQLQLAGISHMREYSLGDPGIPDFVVGSRPWVVVEVKVGGSRSDLLRQISDYMRDDRVAGCLVATTRHRHTDVPDELHGKPLAVAWLSAGAALGGATHARVIGGDTVPTVGQLARSDEGWAVQLQPHARARFKRVFARCRGQFGTMTLDDTAEVCRDLLWYMDRWPLQVSDLDLEHLRTQADRYDRRRARVAAVMTGKLAPRPFTLALPPRPYQATAAELALQSEGLLIGDDLGLGKTVTAIATLTDPTTRPALVVTETHLQRQWAAELRRFAPQLLVHEIRKGTPYDVCRPKGARKVDGDRFHVPDDEPSLVGRGDRPFPDVLITTYSKLAGWADVLAPVIRMVIYDEIQALRKGADSNKGKAAYHLTDNADRRAGLSATPIYNYGDETWAVMRALAPDALGTRAEFIAEWCVSAGGHNHRVKEPDVLGAWLREQGLMVRRTRREVGRELPTCNNVPWVVDCDPSGLEAVQADVRELARVILGEHSKPLDRGRAARELDTRMRQATGIAKAPFVAAFVEGLLAGGATQVVMTGWHREVYRIWLDLLSSHNPVLFTGSESPAAKERSKEAFVQGRAKILIMSLRSGAGLDGLQYTECRDIVHGELDWSPKVHDQATGRLHRDGQIDPVTAWFPYTDEGSDPAILDVLGVKRGQSRGILDPTASEDETPVDEGRIKVLARQLLGRES